MSEQPACSLPLWKVRRQFQELRLDPSLLSGYWKLHQQMSKKEKPLSKWEESFHHRLLNRGAVPNSQFTIIWASYETSACQLMYVPH